MTYAVGALGDIGDLFVVTLLLDVLKARAVTLRKCTADALGQIRRKAATADLIYALANDEHWSVRASAADALRKIADPTAIPALVDASRSESQFVRMNASSAFKVLQNVPP